jgi:hypothetical protein
VALGQHWCRDGSAQQLCYQVHVASELGSATGKRGSYTYRCPVAAHPDYRKSVSVNPGTSGMWMVWHCFAGCSDADVRDALSKLGIDEACLGKFGQPGEPADLPAATRYRADPAVAADARRFRAVLVLPADLGGMLKDMCIRAIADGDGSLPGDPYRLLPVNQDDFIALAKRAGIDRAYAYRLYRKWLSYDAA